MCYMDQDFSGLAESIPEGKWSHFLYLVSNELFFPFEGKILENQGRERCWAQHTATLDKLE